MDPNKVLRIIDNISDSEKCSDDDDSDSDNDVISPMCEHSQVSQSDNDSDNDQTTQGDSGVTCHVLGPGTDMSISDSDDGLSDMPARLTRMSGPTRSSRGRATARGRHGDGHVRS